MTSFFDNMETKKPAQLLYPDHGTTGTTNTQVGFCKYLWESWDFKSGQKLQVTVGGQQYDAAPFDLLRKAYPSREQYQEQFVLLQANINQFPKANVSRQINLLLLRSLCISTN